MELVNVDGIMRPLRDSFGRIIGGGDPAKSKAFWEWAGETKAVDKEGRPLVVFHGTAADFNSFGSGDIGFHFGSIAAANKRLADLSGRRPDGSVVDLTSGKFILPVYLSIKKPLRMLDVGDWDDENKVASFVGEMMFDDEFYEKYVEAESRIGDVQGLEAFRKIFQEMGYDGVVYDNVAEGGGDSFIAFRPNQIKSATGNPGTYCGDSKYLTDCNEFTSPGRGLTEKGEHHDHVVPLQNSKRLRP